MQCQSCGLEVKKNTKNCPACEEPVIAPPTSLIASQVSTNKLEPAFVNELIPTSNGTQLKLNKNVSDKLLNSFIANNMSNTERSLFTKETTPPTEVLSREMLCRRCGNELKPDAKFCSVCGATSNPAKWEQMAKSLQSFSKIGIQSFKNHLSQTNLPIITVGFLLLGSISLLAAIFQYLIPTSVDAESLSPLIYHLRSIQFLLIALVFVVTGSVFNRR